jgi:hypothetical protein
VDTLSPETGAACSPQKSERRGGIQSDRSADGAMKNLLLPAAIIAAIAAMALSGSDDEKPVSAAQKQNRKITFLKA